jgi:hypothetical protein
VSAAIFCVNSFPTIFGINESNGFSGGNEVEGCGASCPAVFLLLPASVRAGGKQFWGVAVEEEKQPRNNRNNRNNLFPTSILLLSFLIQIRRVDRVVAVVAVVAVP